MPLLPWRRMRGFATWTTGHRKTVIIGWIVALIGVGMIAGAVGSDFSEEFKLPASDSQEAFDLLETNFPAQSGGTATIVYKADDGVESDLRIAAVIGCTAFEAGAGKPPFVVEFDVGVAEVGPEETVARALEEAAAEAYARKAS